MAFNSGGGDRARRGDRSVSKRSESWRGDARRLADEATGRGCDCDSDCEESRARRDAALRAPPAEEPQESLLGRVVVVVAKGCVERAKASRRSSPSVVEESSRCLCTAASRDVAAARGAVAP